MLHLVLHKLTIRPSGVQSFVAFHVKQELECLSVTQMDVRLKGLRKQFVSLQAYCYFLLGCVTSG